VDKCLVSLFYSKEREMLLYIHNTIQHIAEILRVIYIYRCFRGGNTSDDTVAVSVEGGVDGTVFGQTVQYVVDLLR
jgi:hypothetical protein